MYAQCACTVAYATYTGLVTFYKVPEKHGHVYLVRLYLSDSVYHVLAGGGVVGVQQLVHLGLQLATVTLEGQSTKNFILLQNTVN